MAVASYSVDPEIDSSAVAPSVHFEVQGSQVTFVRVQATSWSSSAANFSIIPPSKDTFINRAIRKRIPIQVTYTGTISSGSYLCDAGYDALRSLPVIRMTMTESVSFSGATYPSTTIWDVHPDLLLHYDPVVRKKHPLGMPDTYQVLADGIGALNNPLATYDTQEAMPQGQKRGAFQVKSIVSRTSTSFVVQYELIDWVYIPQLLGLDCENELGLTRQSQIVINDTFNFDASRVISHAVSPRTTLTSVSCIMSDQPDLTVKYISVPRELLPQGVLRYKHLKLERFVSAPSGTLAANGVTTITSNNIQLQRVPRYVWFFVREADQNMTRESSNTFCALQAGTYINFNNQGALLSTARLEDWWMMARDCGLQDSYEEFAGLAFGPSFANVGTMGSVGCVQFGRHISLGQGLQIGQAGTFNFNMSVNVMNVNQNSAITTPTLYIIVGYDHEMVISEGGDVSFELPVTPVGMVGSADELIKMPAMVGGALEHRGAGFFDWLQKAHDWIKENKIISKVSGALSSVPLLASVVGPINAAATHLGYSERARGGKAMSREELRQAIKDL